tara:strand:+ start:3659 stop:3814 length:156 start_codon:yes stop_codon:yes gene_type:complete
VVLRFIGIVLGAAFVVALNSFNIDRVPAATLPDANTVPTQFSVFQIETLFD